SLIYINVETYSIVMKVYRPRGCHFSTQREGIGVAILTLQAAKSIPPSYCIIAGARTTEMIHLGA
ncbi:MAG: hypothetical protein K2K95_06845, partial [Muribaculaceae bacterium]|nr:hypothetical protein [Muribaculaceae bacterium]